MTDVWTELATHLYRPYTKRWPPNRREILRQLTAGEPASGRVEEAVTHMLCALDNDAGNELANLLLELTGQPHSDRAVMVDLDWWPELRAPRDRRVPDLGVKDLATGKLLVAGECKRSAAVNGGLGYCRNDLSAYSNQIICYAHKCWASGDDMENTKFIWIHPSGSSPTRSAIRADDAWYGWARQYDLPKEVIETAVAAQEAALRSTWTLATWETICAALNSSKHPASRAAASIVSTWVETAR